MGVKGLLPCLRSITRPVLLERYRGLTVAVDAMSWLHKGVFATDVRSLAKGQWEESERLRSVEGKQTHGDGGSGVVDHGTDNVAKRIDFNGVACHDGRSGRRPPSKAISDDVAAAAAASASKCVAYAVRHAEALRRDFGMEVVMVIDGGSLPSKSQIDRQRRIDRRKAYLEAVDAEARGDTRAARRLYARACSVTHAMRRELIVNCQQAGISFVVAPYEADAQMAKLAHSGAVDLVVTEDSDLLAYGCPRVLFKIDFSVNRGEEIQLMRDLALNDSPSFRNWTHDMFVFMCIVSGCDYCEGVPGIGIKTAHKLVRVHRTPSKIFNALRVAGRMPTDFEETFWIAYRTFRHQRIYCSETQQMEPLFPIAQAGKDDDKSKAIWPFLGPHVEPHVAKGVACGALHPVKKIPWDDALQKDTCSSRWKENEIEDGENLRGKTTRSLSAIECRDNAINASNTNGTFKENFPPKECQGKKSHKDLFAFFPSRKRKSEECQQRSDNDAADSSSSRPPLQEVYIDSNGRRKKPATVKEDDLGRNAGIAPDERRQIQPIPIHFDEYSSKLVGNTFQTLSRISSRGEKRTGRNLTQAMQRLVSKKRVVKQAIDPHDKERSDAYCSENGDWSQPQRERNIELQKKAATDVALRDSFLQHSENVHHFERIYQHHNEKSDMGSSASMGLSSGRFAILASESTSGLQYPNSSNDYSSDFLGDFAFPATESFTCVSNEDGPSHSITRALHTRDGAEGLSSADTKSCGLQDGIRLNGDASYYFTNGPDGCAYMPDGASGTSDFFDEDLPRYPSYEPTNDENTFQPGNVATCEDSDWLHNIHPRETPLHHPAYGMVVNCAKEGTCTSTFDGSGACDGAFSDIFKHHDAAGCSISVNPRGAPGGRESPPQNYFTGFNEVPLESGGSTQRLALPLHFDAEDGISLRSQHGQSMFPSYGDENSSNERFETRYKNCTEVPNFDNEEDLLPDRFFSNASQCNYYESS